MTTRHQPDRPVPFEAAHLAALLKQWLTFELEMYGRWPGHVGVDAHGVSDWFARFAVKWGLSLHGCGHGGPPRSSTHVYRRIPIPLRESGPCGYVDPVIYRPGMATICVKIDSDAEAGHLESVQTIESAARAGHIALFVKWKDRSEMPASPVQVIDLGEVATEAFRIDL